MKHVLLLAAVLALTGCAHTGRLSEYDFYDRTIAVVAEVPSRPYVDTGPDVDLTGLNPVGALIKVGTAIYKDTQAGRLRARLDSASVGLDLADRIAGGVLERSARYLGARAVDDSRDADFHLEVSIEEYGVDAREWEGGAYFRLQARLLLLDREGRVVWERSVDEEEPVTRGWFDPGSSAADVVTGRVLGQLSVAELQDALNGVADYAADRLAEKLREGMEKARTNRLSRAWCVLLTQGCRTTSPPLPAQGD
jgi:hypothetical protein